MYRRRWPIIGANISTNAPNRQNTARVIITEQVVTVSALMNRPPRHTITVLAALASHWGARQLPANELACHRFIVLSGYRSKITSVVAEVLIQQVRVESQFWHLRHDPSRMPVDTVFLALTASHDYQASEQPAPQVAPCAQRQRQGR